MSKRSSASSAATAVATPSSLLISAATQMPVSPLGFVPLGAMAAGVGLSLLASAALAQTPAAPAASATAPEAAATTSVTAQTAEPAQKLPTVTITEKADKRPEAKQSYQAVTTSIGKGKQALRDIPQSITVVTEKLLSDRRIDTVKEALKNTAGITFLAAEGGEEDIRLRGFSLQSTGDIFADGMRDPAFYDRDTFNLDTLEVLRGSASMLFGRGSTGGAVNQVNKIPFLSDFNEVKLTGGNHEYLRATADFNIQTGQDAALRINAMHTAADNNGAGSSINKRGLAASYRTGIGYANEFFVGLYHLDNDNGMNYGLPWIKPRATDSNSTQTIVKQFAPDAYYGMASDYNHGQADHLTLGHTHRFGKGRELKTSIRKGYYERDQRAGTVRFAGITAPANGTNPLTNPAAVDMGNIGPSTIINRGAQLKIQSMENLIAQSDFTGKFDALGFKHSITSGVDFIQEQRTVYNSISSTTTGPLVKPQTTVGTPNDGAWIDEGLRDLRVANSFESISIGAYAQNLVELTPTWKLLGGLRYDYLRGDYETFTPATGVRTGNYQQNISEWSKRIGFLYQPSAQHSFHFSYGTSFNTSGDTYSYSAESANTDPESSRNIELGAKLDSSDGRFTTRLALFHSTKLNERNQDPDTAATQLLLSGQRHVAGFEIDFNGRLIDKLETYVSYTWMPVAKVDKAAPPRTNTSATAQGGNRVGDRPGLTPKHSGSIWNTYQFTQKFRAGLGINFRSKQAPADITNPDQGIWYAPSFSTVDLMAEYVVDKVFTVSANINNVGDKLYAESVYRGHYIPGAGRITQVTLSAKF